MEWVFGFDWVFAMVSVGIGFDLVFVWVGMGLGVVLVSVGMGPCLVRKAERKVGH